MKIDFTSPKYVKMFLAEKLKVPYSEMNHNIDKERDLMLKRWVDSNYTDFGVYQGQNYLYDMLECYYTRSRPTIQQMKKLMDLKDVSNILDYYNGLGVSSVYLKTLYPDKDIYYFNDVKEQIDFMQDYKKRFLFNFDIKPFEEKKYDLVFISEVFEHFEDPEKFFIENIEKLVGKYLVYASLFSDMYIGHFPFYRGIENKAYSNVFHKFLLGRGFKFVGKGFNNTPRIYKI